MSAPITPQDSTQREYVISVLVENQFGVLSRIAGLFGARGFNIDSLAVGETQDPTVSRMTIVAHGDLRTVQQIEKQLNKLVDVIRVQDLTSTAHIERELMLIKVQATSETRSELMQVIDIFKAKIVDFTPECLTVEIVGHQEKLESFVASLKGFGILEMARTGRVALNRGFGGLHTDFANEAKSDEKELVAARSNGSNGHARRK